MNNEARDLTILKAFTPKLKSSNRIKATFNERRMLVTVGVHLSVSNTFYDEKFAMRCFEVFVPYLERFFFCPFFRVSLFSCV